MIPSLQARDGPASLYVDFLAELRVRGDATGRLGVERGVRRAGDGDDGTDDRGGRHGHGEDAGLLHW